jgi:bacillithiol biosynthesis cysteine-adding enzyme BshC
MSNIELLRKDHVVAVVTGQQAGLFGGPLYTLYKALSAVRLAEELTATGVTAVPVFWMATEDHDFEEVSTSYFLDASDTVYRSHYEPDSYILNTPVGKVEIDHSISEVIDRLLGALPLTGFTARVRNLIESFWQSGHTFGGAFGQTVSEMLSEYGLIMVDPMNPVLKGLASPLYVNAIDRSEEIISCIRHRDEQLKNDGFHSQVLVDEAYFPLFWHDEAGARIALKRTDEGSYRAKGQKDELSRDQLLSQAQEAPERFSPGVMLRPAVQDHLLPTVAYFGGGAEISYFAQNSVVYEVLDRPVTPIFHRQSFTIVEPKARKTMDKLSLGYGDLFKRREAVTTEWALANMDTSTVDVFSTAEQTLDTELRRMGEHLSKIDSTLLDNLEKRRRKMLYHVGAIKNKALTALSRKNGDAERRITDLFNVVMPNGSLQERTINAFSFINKYGPNFVKWVYDAVDLSDKRHRFLEISHE